MVEDGDADDTRACWVLEPPEINCAIANARKTVFEEFGSEHAPDKLCPSFIHNKTCHSTEKLSSDCDTGQLSSSNGPMPTHKTCTRPTNNFFARLSRAQTTFLGQPPTFVCIFLVQDLYQQDEQNQQHRANAVADWRWGRVGANCCRIETAR